MHFMEISNNITYNNIRFIKETSYKAVRNLKKMKVSKQFVSYFIVSCSLLYIFLDEPFEWKLWNLEYEFPKNLFAFFLELCYNAYMIRVHTPQGETGN